MREIPLGRTGLVALIDDDDYELVSQYVWTVKKQKKENVTYAQVSRGFAARNNVFAHMMHCLIMGTTGIDHIDHDGLNNQRSNLRVATQSQNGGNARGSRSALSQFKGLRIMPSGRWQARISLQGKTEYLGTFFSEEEAARAYDAKARELFGEFAYLNFPNN